VYEEVCQFLAEENPRFKLLGVLPWLFVEQANDHRRTRVSTWNEESDIQYHSLSYRLSNNGYPQ